jgi:hypothetical protein
MRSRSLLAAAAVLALVVAPSAHAVTKAKPKKPKPLCNLLTDKPGDSDWDLAPGVVKPASLDILGGDLATGPKTMVAVLRLASTDFSPTADPWSRSGYQWHFAVTSSYGQDYAFDVDLNYLGSFVASATAEGKSVPVTFAVVGKSFQWTIQRKDAPQLARPKNFFMQFRGGSAIESGTADTAVTKASKSPDRALSCVRAN